MAIPDPTTSTKCCTKCGNPHPRTSEYFYPDKRNNDGLQSACKDCQRAEGRRYRTEHPDKRKAAERKYYDHNREQAIAAKRRWQLANPEKKREYDRLYNHRHSAQHVQRVNEWAIANPVQVRRSGRIRCRNYYARKCGAEGKHTTADVQRIYRQQHGKCYYCGLKVGDRYDVDHLVPLSRSGSNAPDNLVIACPSCNRSKNDKLPHEWIEGGRLL